MAANFAGILSLAVALFFIGPQLGSIDTDGDGVPDVPVMVKHGNGDRNVQPTQSDQPNRVAVGIGSPFSELMSGDLGPTTQRAPADLRRAELDSITPLRC